jgi:hypothetical protein
MHYTSRIIPFVNEQAQRLTPALTSSAHRFAPRHC